MEPVLYRSAGKQHRVYTNRQLTMKRSQAD